MGLFWHILIALYARLDHLPIVRATTIQILSVYMLNRVFSREKIVLEQRNFFFS